jgi:hypothetical protein
MHDVGIVIETDVPARLDRLPWTRFHTLVVVALGAGARTAPPFLRLPEPAVENEGKLQARR